MRPRADLRPVPELEWTMVPASHRVITPFVCQCNWMQALEGDIDSAHSSFLHSVLDPALIGDQGTGLKHKDRAPRFITVHTEYGVKIGIERTADEDHTYRRVTQFVMHIFTMFTFPRDDTNLVEFYESGLMLEYSRAVILEGDNAAGYADLDVFVAPAPLSGETLYVRRQRQVAAVQRRRRHGRSCCAGPMVWPPGWRTCWAGRSECRLR